jgi:hypothetical protein
MIILHFIVKLIILAFTLLETVAQSIVNCFNRSISLLGRLIVAFTPVVVYNIIDSSYNVTPRLIIFIMGVINTCLNLISSLSLETLMQSLGI